MKGFTPHLKSGITLRVGVWSLSLVWQKQPLFKDYGKVGGPEGKKGKYTEELIGYMGQQKKISGRERGTELVICLFANQ